MTTKSDRVRRIATRVVIFVAALLLTISTVVVWSTRTALNSDRFSKAVESSLDDERVTTALTTYITDQITSVIDLEQIARDLIPGDRDFLAAPLAQEAENFIRTRVAAIVGSEQFIEWFTNLVAKVHEAAIHIAKGESGPVINATDGSVVINVAPAIGAVLTQLGADGLVDRLANMPTLDENPQLQDVLTRIATALNIQIPEDFGQITVMQSDTLTNAAPEASVCGGQSRLAPAVAEHSSGRVSFTAWPDERRPDPLPMGGQAADVDGMMSYQGGD